MATSKSGQKSARQAESRRVFNVRRLRAMRDAMRRVIDAPDKKAAEEALPHAYKSIDKAAKRGVIKKNNAARKKAKLAEKVAHT